MLNSRAQNAFSIVFGTQTDNGIHSVAESLKKFLTWECQYFNYGGVWWVICCYFKLSMFAPGFTDCTTNQSQFGYVCKESSNITQFTHRKSDIYAGDSNMKISQCLGVNLRTVQKIWKELEESNDDYEDIAGWKLHTDSSDKKRIPEFVCKIQAMTDNDPSKTIRYIARDMRVSEFLIRLVVHEDIHYFSYKMRKGQFYDRVWRQSFSANSSIPSNRICFRFSQMRKFSTWIRWWTHSTLTCSVPKRCTSNDRNQIPDPHHGVWGGY